MLDSAVITGRALPRGRFRRLPPFRRPSGAGMVRSDARLGDAILATGDGRLKHQLEADMTVQKKRPDHHDLGIHAPPKPIA